MGKIPASIRTRFVNRALVPIEKNAPLHIPPQDRFVILLRRHRRVLFEELLRGKPQVARQTLYIALRQIRFRNLAAIRACPAIDLLLRFLRYAPESPLRKIVRFHVTAEALVLRQLLFPESSDLNEIRYH